MIKMISTPLYHSTSIVWSFATAQRQILVSDVNLNIATEFFHLLFGIISAS